MVAASSKKAERENAEGYQAPAIKAAEVQAAAMSAGTTKLGESIREGIIEGATQLKEGLINMGNGDGVKTSINVPTQQSMSSFMDVNGSDWGRFKVLLSIPSTQMSAEESAWDVINYFQDMTDEETNDIKKDVPITSKKLFVAFLKSIKYCELAIPGGGEDWFKYKAIQTISLTSSVLLFKHSKTGL